jgi:hypothetical protein
LAAIFGAGALLFGILGCLLYLIVWLSLPIHEKMGIIAGVDTPGSEKVLLPKILNYFSLLAGLAAIVLGVVSICLEQPSKLGISGPVLAWLQRLPGIQTWLDRRPGMTGVVLASAALVILLVFWIWTVSRQLESYIPRGLYKLGVRPAPTLAPPTPNNPLV